MKNWQSANGHTHWRSLEELASTPAFEEQLHREFPRGASEWSNEFNRRDFLRLMGASVALAGLGACTKQPIEKIVPYVDQPEQLVPGKPLYFATATSFGGFGQGIVVTSHEGRPTKIEGNPDHPASRGATTVWAQADVLGLYDPDRAKTITHEGSISSWESFLEALRPILGSFAGNGGAGLRILSQTITSPSLGAQLEAIRQKFPNATWHQWEPLTREAIRGDGIALLHDFSKAKVVVALDADFLYLHPEALRHARDFAARRRVRNGTETEMSRLYVAEPTPTVTGSNADHRLPIAAREIGELAAALLALVSSGNETPDLSPSAKPWVQQAATDLRANRGASIVIAGETQSAEVHELVARINDSLGNNGITITRRPVVEISPTPQLDSLRSLVTAMRSGLVELLVILDGNPVYDAPVDLGFADALRKVRVGVHHTLHSNETSSLCQWLVPAHHFLESWGDIRSTDGTTTIIQPLIEPLYEGTSALELLEALVRQPVRSGYEIVRAYWQKNDTAPDFDKTWETWLSNGVLPSPNQQTQSANAGFVSNPQDLRSADKTGLEVIFRPDPHVLDGRYANNPWLQELPKPLSKITWDNAALISPGLARRERLENGDYVELAFRGGKLAAPVWITPGQAEQTVTLTLGYGRTAAGSVGTNKGYNAYLLRSSDALWQGSGLAITKLGRKLVFATTQNHFAIEGRDMYRSATIAEFLKHPRFAQELEEAPRHDETLYNPNEFKKAGYAWGMLIDLNTCIGCNSCTIACQAENNIPVVGKTQVMRGREMHWIRVDTYYSGAPANPQFFHQPVPCMHCEHAPCELVCPVAATVHDDEGLNLQVYNRCVGTRYCSNNCPYKVRRFNFLEYNGSISPSERLAKNPEVTVRCRGVMEKCTYCLQRINAARYAAELDGNRKIRDGEVVPACAQVCPTKAIVFGDLHDPDSRVSRMKKGPLNYGMLAELNTRPRTSYSARLWNRAETLS